MWVISSLPPFKFHVITKSCLSQVIKFSGIVGVFLSYSCNHHFIVHKGFTFRMLEMKILENEEDVEERKVDKDQGFKVYIKVVIQVVTGS